MAAIGLHLHRDKPTSQGGGVIQSHLCRITLVWCAAASTALQAQQTPVAIGDTVRVRNAVPLVTAGANAGVLVSLTSDTLVLRPLKNLETSTWLLGEGSRLSVKRGEKSFGVVKGMLIGTVFALAGTLIYESGDDPVARGCEIVGYNSGNTIYANCDRDRREAGEVIIPLSAIMGGVAGYLIKRDRWVDVARQQP